MLLLRPSTDSLQLISQEICDLDVIVDYIDRDTTTFVPEGATPVFTNITTATTTTITAAPGAGKVRNIKSINIRNVATTWATVTLLVDVSAVDYELIKAVLMPNDTLEYVDGQGFKPLVLTTPINIYKRLGEDFGIDDTGSISAKTPNGLSCILSKAARYNFLAHIYHTSAAATNGARFAFDVVGTVTAPTLVSTIDTVTASVTASAHSAGTQTAQNTQITAQTAGSLTPAVVLSIISGTVMTTINNSSFAIQGQPEVTAGAGLVVKNGSWFHIWEATT